MQKLKILFIHHHGTGGGASRSLAYLIKNFPEDTIEPHVITPAGSAAEIFRSVTPNVFEAGELPEITSIAGGKFYWLRLFKTLLNLKNLGPLRERIQQIQPDLIHLNDVSLVLVAKLCKKLNYGVIMHARVVLSDHEPFLNEIIKKMAKRYVDRVICIDGSVRNKLHPIPSSIIYNPLHINQGQIPDKEDQPKESCTVLFLANLIAYKGLFDLLEAAALLRDNPEIKIVVAGANSRPPAFFKTLTGRVMHALSIVQNNEKKMKAIIKKNALENVSYLGNIKNINEWLTKTDILVFPSHMNGPSRSIFEAGALGIPSIIALKDVVEDVVVHNKNGVIVPEKDPARLAEAIRKLAQNKNLREALGIEAKTHFRQLNDPQESAKKVLALYQDVMKIKPIA